MDNNQIQNLIERIEALENQLSKISFNEAKEVTITNCPIGDITVGNDCNLNFQNCPTGMVIDTDIEDADSRIDELESRLDDVNLRIDETELKLNTINIIDSKE